MKLIRKNILVFPKPDDIDNTDKGLINIESMGDHTLAIYRTKVDILEIWKIKQSKYSMVVAVDISTIRPQRVIFTKVRILNEIMKFISNIYKHAGQYNLSSIASSKCLVVDHTYS